MTHSLRYWIKFYLTFLAIWAWAVFAFSVGLGVAL